MIYFNDNLKLNVLDMFYNALNNDGLLIIGYFDGMPAGYDKYFDYYDAGLKFFIKKHMKYD
jgi:chemotaxis methyl-accepting protein methylase